MKIDNQSLCLFTNTMATCLASGLVAKKALEMSGARAGSRELQKVIRMAADRCDQGMTVSEALEPGARWLPHYFVPMIRAGEMSGKLAEAFQLLNRHCRRIGPSIRVLRNTWLYPLICILFGWVVRTGILLYFGKYGAAGHFVLTSFGTGLLLVLAGWGLMKLEPARQFIDRALLQMPLIRETEIRQANVLFFSTFRLVYEAGGLGVTTMFDLAWGTIRNRAIREDLLGAREVMEQNGTIGDAFESARLLEDDLKGIIHTGSISGRLDRSLSEIVETATQQLDMTLQIFNQFFQRVVAFSVAMSIVETLVMCLR